MLAEDITHRLTYPVGERRTGYLAERGGGNDEYFMRGQTSVGSSNSVLHGGGFIVSVEQPKKGSSLVHAFFSRT
jgi:hypothetical protein